MWDVRLNQILRRNLSFQLQTFSLKGELASCCSSHEKEKHFKTKIILFAKMWNTKVRNMKKVSSPWIFLVLWNFLILSFWFKRLLVYFGGNNTSDCQWRKKSLETLPLFILPWNCKIGFLKEVFQDWSSTKQGRCRGKKGHHVKT